MTLQLTHRTEALQATWGGGGGGGGGGEEGGEERGIKCYHRNFMVGEWGGGGGDSREHSYCLQTLFQLYHSYMYDTVLHSHLASNPGSHPAFRRLQFVLQATKSEKLDESLGSRLLTLLFVVVGHEVVVQRSGVQ